MRFEAQNDRYATACMRGLQSNGFPVPCRRQRLLFVPHATEMQVGICSIAFHRNHLKVSAEVPSKHPRERQPIPQTSQGGVNTEICRRQRRKCRRSSREKVGKDPLDLRARNAASLIGNLHMAEHAHLAADRAGLTLITTSSFLWPADTMTLIGGNLSSSSAQEELQPRISVRKELSSVLHAVCCLLCALQASGTYRCFPPLHALNSS